MTEFLHPNGSTGPAEFNGHNGPDFPGPAKFNGHNGPDFPGPNQRSNGIGGPINPRAMRG